MRVCAVLALIAPLCAAANPVWTCHNPDGSKVFRDHPCDESDLSTAGVMNAPAPRANDINPGWCAAHRAWRDEAKLKSESTADRKLAAAWSAKQRDNERWLKIHHCAEP